MMKIKLLSFGPLTEIIGEQMVLPADIADTKSLTAYLSNNFPGIEKISYKIAVNRKIISGDVSFKDEDEIALLPPYAGG
jgi:molybdopterin synthase sulfur carrier subunit